MSDNFGRGSILGENPRKPEVSRREISPGNGEIVTAEAWFPLVQVLV